MVHMSAHGPAHDARAEKPLQNEWNGGRRVSYLEGGASVGELTDVGFQPHRPGLLERKNGGASFFRPSLPLLTSECKGGVDFDFIHEKLYSER